MEKADLMIIVVLGAVLVAVTYFSYQTGKQLERRDYTKAYIKQVELAYNDGFQDGMKQCVR